MRPFFTTALALLQVVVVLSQHDETAFHVSSTPGCGGSCRVSSACEDHARRAGLPTDGWEVVRDNEGNTKCRRTAIHELCYGAEYLDADTKEKKCCQDASGLTWINKPAQLAKCCAKDHVWTYDNEGSSRRGGCCPVGFHIRSGTCVRDASDFGPSCPVGSHRVDGQCIPSHSVCPPACGNGHGGIEPSCVCTNYPVCGHGNHLGIKYGHCYILSFADGEQLGLDRDHLDYKKNGFFTDIPFKVCHSTSDCSYGREVELDQPFSLQDQHGLYKDIHSTKGWIDDAYGGAHIKFTLDVNHAGRFTGIPTCAGGECALQLHGSPSGGALAFACPAANPGLTVYGNPKVGQKLRFSEVTCDDYEVPLTSGISLHRD